MPSTMVGIPVPPPAADIPDTGELVPIRVGVGDVPATTLAWVSRTADRDPRMVVADALRSVADWMDGEAARAQSPRCRECGALFTACTHGSDA